MNPNPKQENLKPFKPGDDPRRNANGRPRKLPALDKLIEEVLGAEEDGDSEAYAILEALLTKAKKGDTKAAEILLDRAFGKAKQSIEQKTIIEDNRFNPDNLTDDELRTLAEIQRKSGVSQA